MEDLTADEKMVFDNTDSLFDLIHDACEIVSPCA
jgi:hypothetical protein